MNTPQMFTAAVLTEVGKKLDIIDDIYLPKPMPSQVLVKVQYAGLCHSQLMEVQGLRGEDKYLPHMLGHEGVGRVVAVGEGVNKVCVDDDVILTWIKGDGLCGGGFKYTSASGKTINAGPVTAFSEYVVVSENRLVKKPKDTPDILSVLYGCAVPTGFGMVVNNIPKDSKGSIAFVGLGGIGMSALLASRLYDFENVIAIDINDDKLGLAKTLGATHVVNPSQEDPLTAVLAITGGNGVAYSFESAGMSKTIEMAYSLVKPKGGQCIFASHPAHGDTISIDPFDLICGKNIKGTWGGEVAPDSDIELFGRLYAEGKLSLEHLVSRQYDLVDINQAIDDLQNRKIVRALISCTKDKVN